MNILSLLVTEILYRPIFNILAIFLAIFGGNLGIAIVLLTLTVRLLMIKQTLAGNDMQKWMSALQPKLNELQEKHKDDPKKLSEETMKVFKSDGKWALKWCLMMLIQIPVFIALYYMIGHISKGTINPDRLYSFFHSFWAPFAMADALKTWAITTHFLGIDLLSTKNIPLTVLAGILTYIQTWFTTLIKPATPNVGGQKAPDMGKMMGFMNIFLVFMIASVVYTVNSWVGLYLVTTTLFSVIQYAFQYKAMLRVKWLERTSKWKWIVINK